MTKQQAFKNLNISDLIKKWEELKATQSKKFKIAYECDCLSGWTDDEEKELEEIEKLLNVGTNHYVITYNDDDDEVVKIEGKFFDDGNFTALDKAQKLCYEVSKKNIEDDTYTEVVSKREPITF